MGNDLNYLVHEYVVWRDFRIPCLHKLLDNHRNDSVQLQVDCIRARERR